MKKLLIALALSALMLSGCGIFRSHKDWDKAKQETPLEVPPSMDRPSTNAALVIPPKVEPQSETASATPGAAPAATSNPTSMHVNGDVDSTWRRVGQALSQGDLGTVSAQDEAGHSYELQIATQQALQQKQSFMQKHFSNTQDPDAPSQSASGSAHTTRLAIQVTPATNGGSMVSAEGDTAQAARVISSLKGRLGG